MTDYIYSYRVNTFLVDEATGSHLYAEKVEVELNTYTDEVKILSYESNFPNTKNIKSVRLADETILDLAEPYNKEAIYNHYEVEYTDLLN